MAQIEFGTNDALTNKLWSEGTDAEVLKKVQWFHFVGKDSKSLLQWKDECEKGAGDSITYGLRMQLTEAPRTEGEALEGNEQSLTYHDRNITINEMVDAVRFNNRMSKQRVAFDLRSDAKDGLVDQLSNAHDFSFFYQICGFNPAAGVKPTFRGNNAIIPPSADRHLIAGGITTEELLLADGAAGNEFTLDLIDIGIELAKTATPALRPAYLDFLGRELFVCFIHPYQMSQLRRSDSRFDVVQRAVIQGGEFKYNSLFTGNTIEWNGCLVIESTRIPVGLTDAGELIPEIRRAVICGAQAAAIGWGREDAGGPDGRYSWVEQSFDYKREKGVSAGCIVGLQKNDFDNTDFSTIVISTFSPQSTTG